MRKTMWQVKEEQVKMLLSNHSNPEAMQFFPHPPQSSVCVCLCLCLQTVEGICECQKTEFVDECLEKAALLLGFFHPSVTPPLNPFASISIVNACKCNPVVISWQQSPLTYIQEYVYFCFILTFRSTNVMRRVKYQHHIEILSAT